MVEHLAVNQRVIGSSPTGDTTWKVGRVWFIASVLKTEEQKFSVSSNLTLSSRATIRNATASYHRMAFPRDCHSAGIHRVDLVIP